MNAKKLANQLKFSELLTFCLPLVGPCPEFSESESSLDRRVARRPSFSASFRRRFWTFLTIASENFPRGTLPLPGLPPPNRPKNGCVFSFVASPLNWAIAVLGLAAALLEGWSGVSFPSALSGDEGFSGPEENISASNLRGVVNEGFRNGGATFVEAGCEKRKVCEAGSRRAGTEGFEGESKMLCVPTERLCVSPNFANEVAKACDGYLCLRFLGRFSC